MRPVIKIKVSNQFIAIALMESFFKIGAMYRNEFALGPINAASALWSIFRGVSGMPNDAVLEWFIPSSEVFVMGISSDSFRDIDGKYCNVKCDKASDGRVTISFIPENSDEAKKSNDLGGTSRP